MPIPQAHRAIVRRAKLHDYLLSPDHPGGRSKAAYFRRLGYERSRWRSLEADLREQHLSLEPARVIDTEFGRKYVIEAMLVGPSGGTAMLVSVWIIRSGEEVPRLVSAYPGRA